MHAFWNLVIIPPRTFKNQPLVGKASLKSHTKMTEKSFGGLRTISLQVSADARSFLRI